MRNLIIILALLALPSLAQAYPQFQLSSGEVRCSKCHYAPAGGGLINGFGRSFSEDLSGGGDGRFAYGASLPDWLALGADGRLAAGVQSSQGIVEPLVIPMLADMYGHLHWGPIAVDVALGVRGVGRPEEQNPASFFVSRTHTITWQPDAVGPYVRLGRFFAPYGLRLAEHTAFVRRFLGENTLEETYGLSGGYVSDRFELHLTGLVGDPLLEVGQKDIKGGAAMAELRLGDSALLGASWRLAAGDPVTRDMFGGHAKLWLAPAHLLFMGEVDYVSQKVDGFDATGQLAGHASAWLLPAPRWMFGLAYDHWQPDLDLVSTERDAFSVQAHFFPRAHWEVLLYAREAMIDKGDGGPSALTVLAQLHYYL